jgi:cellobiose phosphorylase
MKIEDRNNPQLYYHFDDKAREVIIHRYDTPVPWMNYFSNGMFHAMMSQAGGTLLFHKSPQIWRINRYRFFHLPTDRSGLYYYIKDRKTGQYWCPTAEPAFTKPAKWRSAHGLGYTRFEAEHNGVKADLCYFIGKYENCIIWNLKLTNTAREKKELDLFAFVEFGMMEFQRELFWFCYNKHQIKVRFNERLGAIVYDYAVEMQPKPKETPLVYLASDQPLAGYDCDRDEFIGSYRSESNPYAIENGGCTKSTLLGGDPCGALQMNVTLEPGASETMNTYLGTAMLTDEITRSLSHCRQAQFVQKSFAGLQEEWQQYLRHYQCELEDKNAERMVNIWNPYQGKRNFQFSRNISYYATGTFRGTGFRDTSQDILSQTPIDLEAAKLKVRELLGQQYQDGHANHYYFPNEGWAPLNRLHSDDHVWPILAVWNIVVEEGKVDFLNEETPYFDGGMGTVYEHLCRAISFTKSHLGANGFPLMLTSDWNDMLYKVCREGKGESIWMSMFLGFALPKLAELAELSEKECDAADFRALWQEQKKVVNDKAWDGEWFRRATMDNGQFLGTKEMDEAKLFINAQSWAVLSGMVDEDRARTAMDSVKNHLDTDLGIKKLWPPIVNFPTSQDPLSHYNKGCGENGAIFCHANTWAIIAECMLGRGDLAWKYYRQLIPNVAMDRAGAWRYKAEPYVYASNLFGPDSDKFGLANVSWLTGTAAWMYVAVTQYILGVRPVWKGIIIDPCIPSKWKRFRVSRLFRGCRVEITVSNPLGVSHGVKALWVEGKSVPLINGPLVIAGWMNGREKIEVSVEMGPVRAKGDFEHDKETAEKNQTCAP